MAGECSSTSEEYLYSLYEEIVGICFFKSYGYFQLSNATKTQSPHLFSVATDHSAKKGTAGIQHPISAELGRLSHCKAGARLKADLTENLRHDKSLFPSIIMGNVNSLPNKIDELSAIINQQIYQESSLFIFP